MIPAKRAYIFQLDGAVAWHFHEVREMEMTPLEPPLRYLRPTSTGEASRAAPAVKRLDLAKVLEPTLLTNI